MDWFAWSFIDGLVVRVSCLRTVLTVVLWVIERQSSVESRVTPLSVGIDAGRHGSEDRTDRQNHNSHSQENTGRHHSIGESVCHCR